MHNMALTADNLVKKNWPANPVCPLCFCQYEIAAHLLYECNFMEALWNLTATQYSLPTYLTMSAQGGPTDWINHLLISGNRMDKRRKIGLLFSFWWQIWKERNRRIFDGKQQSTLQVFSHLQEQFSFLYKALDINHTNS
jgi:hypothetical protein